MDQELEIINNEVKPRFEAKLGDEFAFIDYRWQNGVIVFMHTFVPDAGQGKGIAGKLAGFALEYVKEKDLKMKLYCPYMRTYVNKHPEYKEFIKEQT